MCKQHKVPGPLLEPRYTGTLPAQYWGGELEAPQVTEVSEESFHKERVGLVPCSNRKKLSTTSIN